MNTTKELREWGRGMLMPPLLNPLLSIADRIDAELEVEVDE